MSPDTSIPISTNGDHAMPSFVVKTRSLTYPVYVDWGLTNKIGDCIKYINYDGPVYVIGDSNVLNMHGAYIEDCFNKAGIETNTKAIPAGEINKTLKVVQDLYGWLSEKRCERGHLVVAVGGGMIGDLVGFVSATFLRGIRFVQMPTSLAAMVDASIGGKTGVNLEVGKNLVGAFYQPRMVVADLDYLQSLPKRELASGWAEAIKHGLILDESLFHIFENKIKELLRLEPSITAEVVRRSMEIKGDIVAQDETETEGLRILLNYGHTVGHALEAATGYSSLLHGEAVSIGMVAAGKIGLRMGLLDSEALDRYTNVLEQFGLPTSISDVDHNKVLDAMSLDKKSASGQISWVLLNAIGDAMTSREVPGELVVSVVKETCS